MAVDVQFLGSRDQAIPANGDMPAEADFQPAPVPAGVPADDIPF
jgi:hypothetical protein